MWLLPLSFGDILPNKPRAWPRNLKRWEEINEMRESLPKCIGGKIKERGKSIGGKKKKKIWVQISRRA